jgi:hypothetical protein
MYPLPGVIQEAARFNCLAVGEEWFRAGKPATVPCWRDFAVPQAKGEENSLSVESGRVKG